MSTETLVLTVLNVALAVAGFLGASMIKNHERALKENRDAIDKTNDELKNFVRKEDFKEFRDEQRENFREAFKKLDSINETIARKVDRDEVGR